jgi:hypothetical protein
MTHSIKRVVKSSGWGCLGNIPAPLPIIKTEVVKLSDYQTHAIETQINALVGERVQKEISRLENETREKIRASVEQDVRREIIRAAGTIGNLKLADTTAKEIFRLMKDLDRLSGYSMNDLENLGCHDNEQAAICVLSRILKPYIDWMEHLGEAHKYV